MIGRRRWSRWYWCRRDRAYALAGLLLTWTVAGLLGGCGTTIRPVADFKWRTLYGLGVPNAEKKLEISTLTDPRQSGCASPRAPEPTQIRIVMSAAFLSYENLPEKLEAVAPHPSGLPIELVDTGPLDMTLIGSRRFVGLITGKEILVRSRDRCTLLKIREIQKPSNRPSPGRTQNVQ